MDRLKQAKIHSEYIGSIIKKNERKHYLYVCVLPFSRMYKVGITMYPEKRKEAIRAKYNEPLAEMLATKEGSYWQEKKLHKMISKYKADTSSFDFNPREVFNVCDELGEVLSSYFNKDIIDDHINYVFRNWDEVKKGVYSLT